LLEAGADVNWKADDDWDIQGLGRGWTALMIAVIHGHADAVKTLLDAGADVNAEDENGGTALMHGARRGHTEIVDMLKQAGARE